MSRTHLFFVLLATFLWVSNSESFLSRIGLGQKEVKDVQDTGLDAATDRGKVVDDGSGKGKGGGHGDSNGKGHEQHGNGLGKGHGGSGSPVDCECENWSPWSQCSKTCGGGSKSRNRGIRVPASNGGQACPATSETANCNTQSCGGGGGGGPVDCECENWSPWSSCSRTCGGGSQSRNRGIRIRASNGGRGCPATSESQNCNTQSCGGGGGGDGGPHDCEVGQWGSWGSCSKACGGGRKSRSCSVVRQPSGGGRSCPPTVETGSCNTHSC